MLGWFFATAQSETLGILVSRRSWGIGWSNVVDHRLCAPWWKAMLFWTVCWRTSECPDFWSSHDLAISI